MLSERSTVANSDNTGKNSASFHSKRSNGNQEKLSNSANSLFAGTFDENLGVVTRKTYQEMKRQGRGDLSYEG